MDDYDNETLNTLEARVKNLEAKVTGPNQGNVHHQKDDIVSSLSSLGSKLGNALSTRDRMMMVMKRLDELERYIDPTYGEACDLDAEVKTDLILAQEDKIQAQYEQLNKVASMKKCLDSQNIADTLSSLDLELIKCYQDYDSISTKASQQTKTVNSLMENYNSIILTLTETFIRMDDIVTKLEVAANPEKVLD